MSASIDGLARDFTKAAHGSGMFELWDAFISTFAAFFATGCGNECAWLAERAEGSMKRITEDAKKDVTSLFNPVIDAFEADPKQDLLGDLYMRLGIGNKNIGQFFTPYNVAQAMADLTYDEKATAKEIESHGYVTMNEPAAGGGANAIAYANTLREHGINYQRQAWFVCQELSELTALTCYVQMSILGLPGVVHIGDTLKMEFYHSLYTPMTILEPLWAWRMLGKAVFA